MNRAQQAYEKGYTSFKQKNMENPFADNTVLHKEFERGFNVAYFDNLKKVQDSERKKATARS